VVVGNVAARSNVEVVRAQELGLCCRSLPETLWQEFLSSAARRLVVAGTHGKTTTASMLAWVLQSCGAEPSFMIGGELRNFATNYRLGTGTDFILEGDEYNSAFFDRHAKFHHYRPTHLIITGIEMDHADLFSGVDEIVAEFRRLIAALPPGGRLIACADCPRLSQLLGAAPCRVITYGWAADADFRILDYQALAAGGRISFRSPAGGVEELKVQAIGRHNGENTLAVAMLAEELGFSRTALATGLNSFLGVKRRQELVGRCRDSIYISDFAHHPTAIKRTLEALREHFTGYRLLAVFEPRTATSRRNLFQKELAEAFTAADEVLLAPVHGRAALAADQVLDTVGLAAAISAGAKPARALQGIGELYDLLKARAGSKELVVLMSTGDFGGLYRRMAEGVWNV
ncbi:MAG: UDP-N-acetylmuramate:L-alanyl-gamma-D-glutamyl-meso-diaminopimelate ligase, partial [Deltaproteobacteria bacterium]|nr:UDP-N-acetylmuramate:L-alanyl-gamma-D-glutamyl-meso-diaminopimelate ligase [Deltaproteobacteria bacterium]